jgi:hypothetical protein
MEKSAVEWLHEKLSQSSQEELVGNINLWFEQAKEIEKQQQDDTAIEFSKWCLDIGIYNQFKKTQGINKELLEIYKKEKGL